MLRANLTLSLIATLTLALNTATAQSVILIDGDNNNGDFETVNGGTVNNSKIQQWDLAGNDIDNWTEWTDHPTYTTTGDSGVEAIQVAFLQPGNATYNLTNYQAQVGDVLFYSFDKVNGRDFDITFNLLYDNGAGSIVESTASTPIVTVTGEGLGTYSSTYTVQPGDDLVGRMIGVGFYNSIEYPNLDNVVLEVTPVPEPATLLLIAGCGLALGAFRKR